MKSGANTPPNYLKIKQALSHFFSNLTKEHFCLLYFLFRQVVHGSESCPLPWRDSSSDSPLHLLFHPSNCTSNFWMESVILLGKYVNGSKESCKKTQNTHKCTLLWPKKDQCESCWAWIMQEDCVLATKQILSWFVLQNVFDSLLWNLSDWKWKKGKCRMREKGNDFNDDRARSSTCVNYHQLITQ